jgi:hypothetical protein
MTYSVHLHINNVYTHICTYIFKYVFGYTHAYAYECSAVVVYPIKKKKRRYCTVLLAMLFYHFKLFNY